MAVRFRTQQDVNLYLQKQNRIRRIFAVSLALGLVLLLGLVFWCVNIFIEDKDDAAFLLYTPDLHSPPKTLQYAACASRKTIEKLSACSSART